MSGHDVHSTPTHCENCSAPLHGQYCYACGQSVHSPARHFGHAVEEVFESFWHLDGRAFRTLRDLFFPGRTALNYLAGQRARYIPPVRLFLVLSLLTFFVGRLSVHVDTDNVGFGGRDDAITHAQTVEDVVKARDKLLNELAEQERIAAKVPGANLGLVTARAKIQGEASSRIVELNKRREAQGKPPVVAPDSPPDGYSDGPKARQWIAGKEVTAAPADATATGKGDDEDPFRLFDYHGKPWNPKTNPVEVSWLPGFFNHWLNYKLERANQNIKAMNGDPNAYLDAFMGALPTALFLLMPVFALLLKVCYFGSGRLYLEHLVVALYSHAYLLLVLMAMFLLGAMPDAPVWLAVVKGLAWAALWIWTPIYLFLMQKRVYSEHWLLTLIKYLVIGTVYFVLVLIATVFAALAGIVH